MLDKILGSRLIFFKFMLSMFLFYTCVSHADQYSKKLSYLEKQANGRLGVYVYSLNDRSQFGFHENQRFPMCSTAKLFVVADILKMSISRPSILSQKIKLTKQDILKAEWAPITKKYVDSGVTIKQLCAAAIEYSDNAAMNALLQFVGGPKAVTAFARSIGDHSFQLNRYEPDLNSAIPDDIRDTNTPKAMVISLKKITFGNVLKKKQQALLIHWLQENTTGKLKIRAGVPKSWIVGDKTGSGQYGVTNDIAILFPPHQASIIMAVYFVGKNKNASPNKFIIPRVAHMLTHQWLRK